jgi:hypothetical protein
LGEIVEAPFRSDFQIDQSGDTRSKTARCAIGRIKKPDPTVAQIAKEILADIAGGELVGRGIVESATHNGASGCVGIAAMPVFK